MKRVLSLTLLASILFVGLLFAVQPVFCSSTSPSADTLLGAGAKWAANGGTTVAYVDDYDNLMAHPNPMGSSDYFLRLKNAVLYILEGEGFTVDTFADIPANLSKYSLLYLEAYWACAPNNASLISNYVFNGGGVVLKSGVMCYLVYYSTILNTGTDLSSIASWFGATQYLNSGGDAYVAVANPFSTSLNAGDQLCTGQGYGNAALTSMNPDSQVLATWQDGSAFAFMHTYGQGRVYWQARQVADPETSSTQPPPVTFSEPSSLAIYGSLDYGANEQAKAKIFAELKDSFTMEPISGANVTIQVFDPNDTLWVTANMTETVGTGIYEWQSPDTIANLNLKVGVYVARVTALTGGFSTSEITVFHIDPPSSSPATAISPSSTAETAAFPLYLATIIAVALLGTLVAVVLLKKNFRKTAPSASD